MKLATWNLERARTPTIRAGQEAVLRDLDADVVVLTEPGIAYRSGPGVVTSPPARRESRASEPWVAIVGPGVEPVPLDVPYERLAVAARVSVGERAFVVYGAVLPWLAVTRHAPELGLPGEDFAAIFRRILAEQAADVAALRSRFGLPTIWAGDFNQSLSGPLFGSSRAGRDALVATLGELGMVAWNETGAHATPGALCRRSDLRGARRRSDGEWSD